MLVITMAIANIINIYFFVNQSYNLGYIVLKRMWSLVDLMIIAINTVLIVDTLFALNLDTIGKRDFEATLSLFNVEVLDV